MNSPDSPLVHLGCAAGVALAGVSAGAAGASGIADWLLVHWYAAPLGMLAALAAAYLLEHALTDAKKQGYTHAEVYPLERMQPDKAWFGRMLSLYEKMGFRVVRDLSSELDGRYFIMQKEL